MTTFNLHSHPPPKVGASRKDIMLNPAYGNAILRNPHSNNHLLKGKEGFPYLHLYRWIKSLKLSFVSCSASCCPWWFFKNVKIICHSSIDGLRLNCKKCRQRSTWNSSCHHLSLVSLSLTWWEKYAKYALMQPYKGSPIKRWQTKYAVLILPSFFYSKNIEFVACISFPFFTDTFLQLSVERYSFSIAQLLKSCSRSFPNRSLSSPRSKRASFPCCSNWLFYLLLLLKHRLPDPPLQRPAPLTKSSHSLQQLPLHTWGKP